MAREFCSLSTLITIWMGGSNRLSLGSGRAASKIFVCSTGR